jgi:hypothetical protein
MSVQNSDSRLLATAVSVRVRASSTCAWGAHRLNILRPILPQAVTRPTPTLISPHIAQLQLLVTESTAMVVSSQDSCIQISTAASASNSDGSDTIDPQGIFHSWP